VNNKKTDPKGLILVLSAPSLKGVGPALRARTLWNWVLIFSWPNSLEKGQSDQLGPGYSPIVDTR
jgi:hypothetical protein